MSMLLPCDTMSMKNFLSVTLIFFNGGGTTTSSSMTYYYTQEEWMFSLLYMYSNMEEMEPYFM
jgi:hypothetical protein